MSVVDSQRAIADEAVKRCLPDRKVEAVAAEELPGEIASDAKATDIAEELKLLPWRQLVAHAQTDKRVDPFEVPDRATAREPDLLRPRLPASTEASTAKERSSS